MTKRKRSNAERTGAVGPSLMIDEFCDKHQVSRALLYKQIAAGKGPKISKVGRRTIITAENEAAWLRLL